MASDVELALVSVSAYQSTRNPINRLFEPLGWTRLKDQDLPGISARLASMELTGAAWHVTATNGFEAVAYQKGAEVVIAFAGWAPLKSARTDAMASVGLGAGQYVEQLRDAALYYVALKEALTGAEFTLTGHSLGGGLAALLPVYFGEPAVIFDWAPFGAAALADHKTKVASDLSRSGWNPIPIWRAALGGTTTVANLPFLVKPHMRVEANKSLRFLYCASLLATIVPTVLPAIAIGSSVWPSLAIGGRSALIPVLIGAAIAFALGLFRIVLVVRVRSTLDSYLPTKTIRIFRRIGIALMILGLLGVASLPLAPLLPTTLFTDRGTGLGLYVVGYFLVSMAHAGWVGIVLFELSRLLGFEFLLGQRERSGAEASNDP